MIHSLLRIASHLDVRGQYDLADRCERLAAKYEWPKQYALPFDEDPVQDDSTPQDEPTPYWQATNALDPQDAPGAVIPKDFYSHPSQEELEAGNFAVRPSDGDDYGGDDWWVALPGAYDRLYQLIYTLNEIEDEERRAGGGQYLDDSRNNRLLRLKLRRPEIEAEAETMARQIAARSYQIIREWIDGHISHSHPLLGGTEEDILDDVYSDDEEKIETLRSHILATVKLMFSEKVADVEQIARVLGVSVDDARRYRFDMDWEEELSNMVEEATAYDEGVDVGPEMVMDMSYYLRRLIDTPEYSKARRQEVEESHPQFKPMVELANMFESANNWRDLIIPIDLTKDMLHRNGNLMQDYGGFHSDLNYQKTFDDISSGAREPVWDADIRRSSRQGRFVKLAMPYRWEDSEGAARTITQEGYDPAWAVLTYIDEYADQFADDLSDEAKQQLEAYAEEIDLEHELQTHGRGGRRWDKYVEKLSDLWINEHPDEVLLWLANSPDSAIEFGGTGGYDNNLLRYTPPPENTPDAFLNDHSYGYATKVKLPPGQTAIPPSWFSVVDPQEWEQHRDDWQHWASDGSRFVRLAALDDRAEAMSTTPIGGYWLDPRGNPLPNRDRTEHVHQLQDNAEHIVERGYPRPDPSLTKAYHDALSQGFVRKVRNRPRSYGPDIFYHVSNPSSLYTVRDDLWREIMEMQGKGLDPMKVTVAITFPKDGGSLIDRKFTIGDFISSGGGNIQEFLTGLEDW